jgi:3-oxoacyl-[acyl-carrier protein] reductase
MSTTHVALVTGATEGIGRATAFALGQAGYRVAACARTQARVEALVTDLRSAGIQAEGAAADVADADAIGPAIERLTRALGDIDVLVNNAGVLIARPLEELTVDEWDLTMATNLRGLFLTTRAVLPGMRARRRGTIVNVASLSGKNGFPDGVRVIAVCPGSVATGMLQDQPMLKSDPRRILRPEDVADVILQAVRLPERAMVSEVDIRPTNP